MEFFRIRKDIPFMKHALVFNVISLVTFLLAVFFLATKGLHFSVEFTGGTLMEVSYSEPPALEKLREALAKEGYAAAQVQNFGSSRDVLIRLPNRDGIETAADPAAAEAAFVKEYRETFFNPYRAADLGQIDEVIEPCETRPRLIRALEVLRTKVHTNLPKKHGLFPV